MRAVVKYLLPSEDGRVLAVSDVHGNLPFLKGLLAKASFSSEDTLILVGDLLEKGPESLNTLRYVMELCRGGNVHVVAGNCDETVLSLLDGDEEQETRIYGYLLCRPESILCQMGERLGFTLRCRADMSKLRRLVEEHYGPEIRFLRALPTIIETPRFLFVHGGVPSEKNLTALDAWGCMKNDDFLHQDTHLRKWCVVGHWPVTLYDGSIPSARPIISLEKRVVSIDGGCVLKWDGQLNALVLPRNEGEDFSYFSYDGLPTAVALEKQKGSAHSINVRWFENRVTVLERGEEFCRCRHDVSGRELDILTEYILERGNATTCEDSTDYRLQVEPGDVLSVVRRTSRGLLAKKDGVTGWYAGAFRET